VLPINVFFVVVFFLFYDASWSGDDDPQEDLAKFDYKWSGDDDDPQEDLAKFDYKWSGDDDDPQEDLAKLN
jgi:hypothetical protein